MRRLVPAVLVPLVAACASGPVEAPGTAVVARAVAAPPALDGVADDAAWAGADTTIVPLTGLAAVHEARVAAVIHGDSIHMLVRWPDATEDREHKLWAPKEGGGFSAGPEREDVLAIGFPISGEFTGDMESPVECVWDVWHWKAGRTDPAGFAMDKRHVNTLSDPGTKGWSKDLGDGRTLHIRRPEDKGTSATRSIKAPESGAARTVAYVAQAPSESAADVRAKAAWKDGWWTLELSRRLDTGNADDARLVRGTTIPFALAVLDHGEDDDHNVSPVLTLTLE